MNTPLQMPRLTALACLALLSAAPAAHAGLVTFDFGGTITRTQQSDIDPFAYTGHYSFESEQPDLRPDDPQQGSYRLSSIEVTFGSTHLVAGSSLNELRISNDSDFIFSPVDSYSLFGTGDTNRDLIGFAFLYDSGDVFLDDSLHLTPPPVTGVVNATLPFSIRGFGTPDGFFGSVTSLTCSRNCDGRGGGDDPPKSVPEPSALIGMAMTLPLLALTRLRKRRRR
jgi:hypothetical protein